MFQTPNHQPGNHCNIRTCGTSIIKYLVLEKPVETSRDLTKVNQLGSCHVATVCKHQLQGFPISQNHDQAYRLLCTGHPVGSQLLHSHAVGDFPRNCQKVSSNSPAAFHLELLSAGCTHLHSLFFMVQ